MFSKNTIKIGMVLGLIGLLLIQCGRKIDSYYTEKELQIDGSLEDWEREITYLKEGEFAFGVANNEKHLYLCMVSLDPVLNRAIFRRGMTTWFDSEGGNNEEIGITFPRANIVNPYSQRNTNLNQQEQPGNEQGNEIDLTENLTDFILINEKKQEEYLSKDNNSENIRISLNQEANKITYELKLPLKTINIENIEDSVDTKLLGLGFELGDKQEKSRQSSQNQPGVSVGTNSQNRNRRRNQRNSDVSRTKTADLNTWLKVKLKQKQNKN